MSEARERQSRIVRASLVGIGANALLAAFKAAIGLLSHSIAVVMDAVNNLSDALSSIITIVGTRLAGRLPDKQHPYGHGRSEYLTAALISLLVLYAGLTSLVESIRKILSPETPDYSPISLAVMGAAIVTKLLLSRYLTRIGHEAHSDALRASGKDALMDAAITVSTLAAAVLYLTAGISVEAWLAAGISLIIIHSGVGLLRDTFSRVIGQRVPPETAQAIKAEIAAVENVEGVYDLVVHDYGPDRSFASVHVEVPDTLTADQIDMLSREIQERVYQKNHVIVTAVGIYAHNTTSGEDARLREEVRRIVSAHPDVLQVHGFHWDAERRQLRFDLVVDFRCPDRGALYREVFREVSETVPDAQVTIVLDADSTD